MEGVRGLFKGCGANIIKNAPATAINFALYDSCKVSVPPHHTGTKNCTHLQSFQNHTAGNERTETTKYFGMASFLNHFPQNLRLQVKLLRQR
eukprot:6490454-Amphidinium_carterae.4